jgi:hypothetical protein
MAIIALLLCMCLAWLPCSTAAVSTDEASEPISPDRECLLTLNYSCNGISFENLPVQLYQIAAVSAEVQYTLTPEFQSSGLELNGIQSGAEWNTILTTLEAHILAEGISPDHSGATDPEGRVTFEALEPGMYLVASVRGEENGWTYQFRSALIALPGLDTNGLWQYEVGVNLKAEVHPPEEPEELQFQLLKLWKDEGNEDKRPVSIEAEIFRNGKSYATVVLSEENNWSYSWTAPADGARWMVVERNIPEGYTLTVEERTTTFILTNSIPQTPDDNPQTGDSANILLVVVLLQLSGAGLIALGLIRKRFEA